MSEIVKAGEILQKLADIEHFSLRKQAQKLEISPAYLSDIYHGNRKLTAKLIEKITVVYKYRYEKDDLVTLISEWIGEECLFRYKTRLHETDSLSAAKNLFFILTGVNL